MTDDRSRFSLFEDGGELQDTAQRLRGALAAEADRVAPGHDGLRLIKERIAADGNRGARGPLVPLLAASVAVLAAVGATTGIVVLHREPAGPAAHGPASPTAAPATTRTAAPAPTPSATTSISPAGPTGPVSSATTTSTTGDEPPGSGPGTKHGPLPVYWIGTADGSPRLYREFVADPAGAATAPDRVGAAVRRMLAGGPEDPDYGSPWRASRVDVTVTRARITVGLQARAFAGQVSPGLAAAALQQLVYTATAAAGSTDPGPPRTVRLLVDGRASDPWGIDLTEPLAREAALLPDVWVLRPAQGERLEPGRVTVAGVGRGFEGGLGWEITDTRGRVVASGTTQGGSTTLQDFAFAVQLPPGTYSVAVWSPSPKDGADTRPFADTKTFTVR